MAIIPAPTTPAARLSRADRFRHSLGAFSEPKYARYWLGSLASVGAIQVVTMGMGWLIVEDLGGSRLTLGYLGAAIAVPTILVNLFGGVLADRLDRRYIIMVISGATASLLTLLAFLVVTDRIAIWHVVAIAAAHGFIQGFDGPVRSSFFPLLIDRKHMMSAVALNSVMWQFSRIVTPAIGGFAIDAMGTESVFFAGAGGWVTMLVVMLSLRIPHSRPTAPRRVVFELQEGVRFIARNRLFATLMPLTFANMFFGMQYLHLMPLFARKHEVGSEGMGVLFMWLGLGALTGTLLVGRQQRSPHIGKMMLAGTFLFSIFVTAFAHAPSYRLAIVFIYFAGITNSSFLISSMTALQLRVPPTLRGRVMGIYTITFSLIPLGGMMGGAVAEVVGESWAVTLAAGVLAAIVLYVFAAARGIRNLSGGDLEDQRSGPATA